MSRALDTAEGLVTVSSTAAIEAVARGIPVIALDSFGVDDKLINPVFVGSGLFGSEDAVIRREFRLPPREWLARNYFHDPAKDDWVAQVGELVALRRAGELPAQARPRRRGGTARDVWERKLALGSKDRSFAGAAAYVIGHAAACGAPARPAPVLPSQAQVGVTAPSSRCFRRFFACFSTSTSTKSRTRASASSS